ncbi:MAG: tRNA (adenosine(37)-N6)-threonylcarbamoyltransferase complex dimerization subunit type 1 TsaB [Clostridia bacterium]|nr:tRNA (adenosine(37)-N6)-threonylcarbamoyltransferase complex dimerization subunit type 1 TsaB [Clostridia bacterium]
MKLLAIDTTANTAAAALLEDGRILASYQQNGTMTHSETMLSMIENLLANAQSAPGALDMLAVSVGPGSFTGVRIGVSVIKGLAFGRGIPCVPVSTLDALSENLRSTAEAAELPLYVCPVMDARRSQLYTALFVYERDADGTLIRRRVWEDDMLSAAELASRLSAVSHRVIFVGEGCRVTAREIALPHCTEADESVRYQNGVSVARAALRVWMEAEDRDAFTDLALKPTYLRPSQAERERAEKQQ